jgi:glycerol uptake facilitator-like aquaporin
MSIALSRRLAAEFLGTGFLLATVVGSGIMAEALAGGNVAVALIGNTLATGAILFVLISAFGPVSGAHFNPAVTLVFALRKEISWLEAGLYVVIQFAAAIAGVLLAHAMFDLDLVQNSAHARNLPGMRISEAVATFGLVFTILAVRKARQEAVPTAVALYVTAGYWFTASTCFANPAVTLARSLTNSFSGIASADVGSFIAFQIVGAVAGHVMAIWLLALPAVTGPGSK